MIHLTRLNSTGVTVNSDLIKYVEQSPDTVITLLTGEKLLVRESAEDILDRIVHFRRRLLAGLSPGSQLPLAGLTGAASPAPAADESEG